MRESSDNPILSAFCRVAPSLRFNVLAIFFAGVFLRASDFSSRTGAVVQARLFDVLFMNVLPVKKMRQLKVFSHKTPKKRRSSLSTNLSTKCLRRTREFHPADCHNKVELIGS
jgi:hypothetical protein